MRSVLAVVLATGLLQGCTGPSAKPEDAGCGKMAGAVMPASAIALPTTGAVVTSASAIPAGATLPPYCKVLGSIKPVDPAAPPINFELDLPAAWNGKAMMLGGGGFNGTIPNTAGNVPAGPVDQPVPLARGYAVFASDSGHQVVVAPEARLRAAMDASFALNPEALRNFTGDALKKTRDTAMHLIRQHYGVAGVKKAYFAGGSTGGREALQVVQRWPEDWDGVISWYPAWNHITLVMQVDRVAQALAAPGGWINPPKRRVLFDAVLSVCDKLDGLEDGVVSNVVVCNAAFDAAEASVKGKPLRCRGGADTGDTCLSDAQIQTLRIIDTPLVFSTPLASGETHYPGYNVYGADLGMPGEHPLQAFVTALALGASSPGKPPVAAASPAASVFWDQWLRYIIAGDPGYDALSVDPATGGALRSRIDELSRLLDTNKTDYSAFAGKGGKILLAHGAADVLVSARSTGEYVRRVQSSMGEEKAREFMRYYEVPGYGHGPGTVFNAAWDSLTALENWVEKSIPPSSQVVTDSVGVPGRTRPLCEYPQWPKYKGSGDVNAASSFECAAR